MSRSRRPTFRSATGYDRDVVRFVSGTVAADLFNQVCLQDLGCFGGIGNTVQPPISERLDNPLGPQVQFFTGVTFVPTSQTGAVDPGVNGVPGGPQFQLIFEIVSPGFTTIDLGASHAYGDGLLVHGTYIGVTNDAQVVIVIPEPGTAMLMGLGLGVLAWRRSSE